MCRLLGWSAPGGTTATAAAGGDTSRLRALSRLHADGWGAAWYRDGTLERARGMDPAHASAAFDTTVADVRTDVGLVHLRWATDHIPTRLPNTHPFVHGDIAFAHNGALQRGPELDVLIEDDLLAGVEGDTDSERYFLALLSARRKTSSFPEAVAKLLAELGEQGWSSLNFVMTEPGRLFALCRYAADRRPEDTDIDYFQMHFSVAGGTTVVWSSGVRREGGSELPNGHLLIADTLAGDVRLMPV
ncbi:MAG: class II glutamine amidotransferase [Actinomycetes bacterium]